MLDLPFGEFRRPTATTSNQAPAAGKKLWIIRMARLIERGATGNPEAARSLIFINGYFESIKGGWMVVVRMRDREVEMSKKEAMEKLSGELVGQKRPVDDFKRFALDVR
jgi:hypothetical protein